MKEVKGVRALETDAPSMSLGTITVNGVYNYFAMTAECEVIL